MDESMVFISDLTGDLICSYDKHDFGELEFDQVIELKGLEYRIVKIVLKVNGKKNYKIYVKKA